MRGALTDRRVHAKLLEGGEIVRYDRAGKWYYEKGVPYDQPLRKHITFGQAIEYVSCAHCEVFYGIPGGSMFDRRIKERFHGHR